MVSGGELAESKDGHPRPLHLYTALMDSGVALGTLVRRPSLLEPGQTVKIKFALPGELRDHPAAQLLGREGVIRGWIESENSWLVRMYAGYDALVSGQHVVLKAAEGGWIMSDITDGDSSLC